MKMHYLRLNRLTYCLQILKQWEHGRRNSLKNVKEEPAKTDAAVGGRSSLTGLLVSRSEDAVATQTKAVPASPTYDIDSDDTDNPLAAAQYAGDIFAYYRRVEPVFRASPEYMKAQVMIFALVLIISLLDVVGLLWVITSRYCCAEGRQRQNEGNSC